MTFYEAAIEILRNAGRPLHYKKITELAIQNNLLSHIGKTPEVTMQARLNQEVQKEWGATIVCVRPGVYLLVKDVDPAAVMETAAEPPVSQRRMGTFESRVPVGQVGELEMLDPRTSEPHVRGNHPAPPQRDVGLRAPGPPAGPPEHPIGVGREPFEAVPPAVPAESTAGAPGGQISPVDLMADLLQQSEAPASTQDLARRLSMLTGKTWTPSALDLILLDENVQRCDRGSYPRFTRQGGGWVLSESMMDRHLKAHFSALESAYTRIRETTEQVLAQKMEKLPAPALEALVTATLGSLGFHCQVVDRREPMVTLIARGVETLIELTVAVRIRPAAVPPTEQDVAALRGQLHHYGATHGVLMVPSIQGIPPEAAKEARSRDGAPIVLVDARGLAHLALKAGVAVQSYSICVPLPDATWFI